MMREVIIPEMRAEIVRKEIGKQMISGSVHISRRKKVVRGPQKEKKDQTRKKKTGPEGKF